MSLVAVRGERSLIRVQQHSIISSAQDVAMGERSSSLLMLQQLSTCRRVQEERGERSDTPVLPQSSCWMEVIVERLLILLLNPQLSI